MTLNKKERLLQIINDFQENVNNIPDTLQQTLSNAQQQLEQMSDDEVEMKTDNTFSSPAHTHSHPKDDPEFMLFNSYGEMERLIRQQGKTPEAEGVLKELQYYFSIEEKDGYFP
ncbi:hypothetical protein [Bacillus alkalicellulosilyticus]|uniref:hypothetical protein n=1 Tax=Alkalihalobacterium alkalicellulosilyticum TaxID=1912214 RepID=UPI000996DBAA|nr:hypothetical protein [Bacillus alkalicellulosilyticus]